MIRLAISADGHVNEPADLWTQNLTPSLVEDGPRFEVRDGMIATVVEGKLLGVNPYGQPGVEAYKQNMARRLGLA